MQQKTLSLLQFQKKFGTEKACQKQLFRLRWPEGFKCPRSGMRRALAPHRLPGRRYRQALCLSHQPFQAGGQDHRRHLQRTLADRDLLPFHQAEPEDQGFHRQLGKRRADPDLCRSHRLSLALLSQVPVQLENYFAKLHQDTTTQPFQDLYRAGTLRTS